MRASYLPGPRGRTGAVSRYQKENILLALIAAVSLAGFGICWWLR